MPNVLGVLAGGDMPAARLRRWADWADEIFAADAGADLLHAVGADADFVIGDFDSFSGDRSSPKSHWNQDQETTDCDKLLLHAVSLGRRSITLASVEGDQLDHMIATLHSAAKHPIDVRIALRTGIGWVLVGPIEASIDAPESRRVSLLPLTEARGVAIQGVEWPLYDTDLHPLGQTSVGNRSSGGRIALRIDNGVVFFFIETVESDDMELWELEHVPARGPSA